MSKVVIIDDDDDILTILKMIFQSEGFDVSCFNISLSISQLVHLSPDLIVLDEWLKDGKGSDICKAVKANSRLKNIPVYIISAVTDLERIAAECCADGFIEKPFDLEQVEALARRFK